MTVGVFGPWETLLGFFTVDGTTSPNLGWYILAAVLIAAISALGYWVTGSRVNCIFLALAGAVGTTLSLYDEWRYGSAYGTGWGLGIEIGASLVLLVLAIGLGLPARSIEAAEAPANAGTSLRSGSGKRPSRRTAVVFLAVFFFLFGATLLPWPWNDGAWIAFGLIVGLDWRRPRTRRERAVAFAKWDRQHPDLAAR